MSLRYKIIFSNIILVLAFFPYLSISKTMSDLQPWALIAASVFAGFLLWKEKKDLPLSLKILLAVSVYSGVIFIFLFLIGKSDFWMGLRSFLGYFSIFIFAFIGYKTFPYLKTKYFVGVVSAWLAVAFSQLLFGVAIVSPFLSRFSAGGNRGLTSLASEPAFYATMCIVFLIINEFLYYGRKYDIKTYSIVFLFSLLQIILSYSGVGIMLLILFGFAKSIEILFIKEEKQKKLIAFIALFLVIFSIFLFTKGSPLVETRAGEIVQQSVKSPVQLVEKNLSVSRRLMNPVLGLYGGLIETHGVGFGLGSKEEGPVPVWLSKLIGEQINFGGRIEGGLVQSIYELGIVGVFFNLVIFFGIIFSSIKKNSIMRPVLITSFLVLCAPMFIFGSVALPMFGCIIGIHLFYLKNKDI